MNDNVNLCLHLFTHVLVKLFAHVFQLPHTFFLILKVSLGNSGEILDCSKDKTINIKFS